MAFGKPATSTPAAAGKPATSAAARPTSATKGFKPEGGKYSALRPAAARHPLLETGSFVLEVVKTFESRNKGTGNKWFHADFLILESDSEDPRFQAGKNCTYMQCVSDNAIEVGGPKVIAFIMNCCGFEESQEADFYAQFGGDEGVGEMIDAASGVPDAEKIHGANPMAGYKVRCQSYESGEGTNKKGKTITYYDQSWAPYVADEAAAE